MKKRKKKKKLLLNNKKKKAMIWKITYTGSTSKRMN